MRDDLDGLVLLLLISFVCIRAVLVAVGYIQTCKRPCCLMVMLSECLRGDCGGTVVVLVGGCYLRVVLISGLRECP